MSLTILAYSKDEPEIVRRQLLLVGYVLMGSVMLNVTTNVIIPIPRGVIR